MGDWARRATKMVAYEHPEEGNIHCHILLMGVYCTDQTLKDDLKSHGVGLKGAGQLSFKTTFKSPDKVKLEINEETCLKFITYMSKGKYEPKYFTTFTQEDIKSCKDAWINYRHKSKDEILYTDFVKYIMEREKTLSVTIEDIRPEAIEFAKRKYGVINLGCRRDAAMLRTTYEYEFQRKRKVVLPFD